MRGADSRIPSAGEANFVGAIEPGGDRIRANRGSQLRREWRCEEDDAELCLSLSADLGGGVLGGRGDGHGAGCGEREGAG